MNFKRILYIYIFSLFFLFIFPKVSFATHEKYISPVVFVENVISECLDIFRSEKNKELQKEKILNLMVTYFDFSSITDDLLRGLKIDDKDKLIFTDLFPLILEMRYSMFVKSPDNISVEYRGYEIFSFNLEKEKAIVYTQTMISSYNIALNYKLHRANGKWKIYDITADGISLVSNYRAQIRKTLVKMSFSDFLIYLEGLVKNK